MIMNANDVANEINYLDNEIIDSKTGEFKAVIPNDSVNGKLTIGDKEYTVYVSEIKGKIISSAPEPLVKHIFTLIEV